MVLWGGPNEGVNIFGPGFDAVIDEATKNKQNRWQSIWDVFEIPPSTPQQTPVTTDTRSPREEFPERLETFLGDLGTQLRHEVQEFLDRNEETFAEDSEEEDNQDELDLVIRQRDHAQELFEAVVYRLEQFGMNTEEFFSSCSGVGTLEEDELDGWQYNNCIK